MKKDWLLNLAQYETPIGEYACTIENHTGFWSQHGEEGVIEYLIDNIGSIKKFILDIGSGNTPLGSNSFRLLKEHAWDGILIDALGTSDDKKNYIYHEPPRYHFVNDADFDLFVSKHVNTFFEKDTIVDILEENKCPKQPGILSLDIDGMDYWILKTLLEAKYTPSIAIVEFNPKWHPNESYTVKYRIGAKKNDKFTGKGTVYGASLLAFTRLFEIHGYTLIHVTQSPASNGKGSDPKGNNAFFIKNNLINNSNINDINELFPKGFIQPAKQKAQKSDKALEIKKGYWEKII